MRDFDKLGIAAALYCQVTLFDTYHCFSHPKSESRKGLPFRRMLLQSAEQSLIPPPSVVQAVPKHNNIPDSCWAGNSLSLRENCRLRFQAPRPSKARDWVGTAWLKCPRLGFGALTTHSPSSVPAVAEALHIATSACSKHALRQEDDREHFSRSSLFEERGSKLLGQQKPVLIDLPPRKWTRQ